MKKRNKEIYGIDAGRTTRLIYIKGGAPHGVVSGAFEDNVQLSGNGEWKLDLIGAKWEVVK
jgi:hypothetical protein